ncbi:hypothetical protein [Rhodococcus tukisamuensis]|uniref:Uncharacterized protein n=1 Tax=Rhodococcus tukisamuensis TaxID=168276 RepID=A0A1G6QRY1_9NOCA|nr:hypothetical protein [Rhodococcus tukisamuensis]SDC95108.1 hypothetical protein SAMN05444580_102184 [Rhodococcus tukisamuensis]
MPRLEQLSTTSRPIAPVAPNTVTFTLFRYRLRRRWVAAASTITTARPVAATGEDAPESWRRPVGFMLQAFAAEVAAPLPRAPESGAMDRATVRAGAGVTR